MSILPFSSIMASMVAVILISILVRYLIKKITEATERRLEAAAEPVAGGEVNPSSLAAVGQKGAGKRSNFKSLFILKKFNKYLPYLLLMIMISIIILNKNYNKLSYKIK